MSKKSLVSYDFDDDEDPPIKRPKAIKRNLRMSNSFTQTYEEFVGACQNCIAASNTTNTEETLHSSDNQLKDAHTLIKKLQNDIVVYNEKIAKMKEDGYELEKKIYILEQTNQKIIKEANVEREKHIKFRESFDKLEKDYKKMADEFSLKEKKLIKMKDEELDEYKKMAEKFIAKADEEKEVESERADEAEANIAELKIQISSLNMATDLKNVEINRLQTAYNQLYLETNSVPNEAINDKVRRRAQREAKELFATWRNNYVKNKNSQIEFQNDDLKKKLQKMEVEKEREIKNSLNHSHRINNLESERQNLLSTIKEQRIKISDLKKDLESKNNYLQKEQQEKETSNKSDNLLMKELNNFKENITELIQKQNDILLSTDSSSATSATTLITPKWKVSKKLCNDIWKKCNDHIKLFLEEYTDQLFSFCEQLLPEKVVENTEKWSEVKAVINHFFKSEDDNEKESNLEVLKEVISGKRYRARHRMYRNCSNVRLCAITSTDKIFYYLMDEDDDEFYVPYADQECKNKLEYQISESSFMQYGIPKEYQNCPFIIIVKDDEECQQVTRMECTTGSTKVLWERKKNLV